ncbi:hypothetical protein TKK_0018168 [Trichogramma kaykai]
MKSSEGIVINGVRNIVGMVNLKIKIMDIEKDLDVYLINDNTFKHDFLMGLNIIKELKLAQHADLSISQEIKVCCEEEGSGKEILINFNELMEQDQCEMKMDHLNEKEKNEINSLIEKYITVFTKDKFDVGTVKKYETRIDLQVEKYCSKRPYRCSLEDGKKIEDQVTKLLEIGLIEESYSPFAAPVTLVFKKEENKKSRLCIDFRELNKIITPQAQPFPLIQDLIIKARNCEFFSTFDINSAFWSIPLRIKDRSKTGFVTQDGHFQWTCLPFGMKTSPAIFQRILSGILRKYRLSDFAVNYIDDILIFSRSFEEHIEHIAKVLEAIISEGFKLKFTKCRFAEKFVKYLGHIIGCNTVKPLKDNLTAIKSFPTPKNQKNIRQFLRKVNFYHEYIPRITTILEPLHSLLKKDKPFVWSDACERAFEEVKNLLCSQPVLEIFDQELPIIIYSDASLEGIGAVLKQKQRNGEEKTVEYFSRKLNEAQKKKKAVFLECLAIKEAIAFWQYWLLGKPFTVVTDHKPLENLNIKSRIDEELGDLTYYISQFDVKIKYSPGKR